MVFEVCKITFDEILGWPICEVFRYTAKSVSFVANLILLNTICALFRSIFTLVIIIFLSPYFCPYKFLLVDA